MYTAAIIAVGKPIKLTHVYANTHKFDCEKGAKR